MKKGLYFLPCILYSCVILFLHFMRLSGGLNSYATIFLFFLSGLLLAKGKWWGGIFGVIPGIFFIYVYFDNVINHLGTFNLKVGIILILFYVICSAFVF